MHSVFASPAELERVKKFGAVEGGKHTLDRLAEFLAAKQAATVLESEHAETTPSPRDTFTVERAYDAPLARVFDAWSDAEAKAALVRVSRGLEIRVDTSWTSVSAAASGCSIADTKGVAHAYDAHYQDIVKNERIVYSLRHAPG